MGFQWVPHLWHVLWRAFLLLWSWSGLGWAAVLVSVLLLGRKISRNTKVLYQSRYSRVSSRAVLDVATRSLLAAFESRDTKIAACSWAALFVIAIGRVIWSDYSGLSVSAKHENASHEGLQILASALHDTLRERDGAVREAATLREGNKPTKRDTLMQASTDSPLRARVLGLSKHILQFAFDKAKEEPGPLQVKPNATLAQQMEDAEARRQAFLRFSNETQRQYSVAFDGEVASVFSAMELEGIVIDKANDAYSCYGSFAASTIDGIRRCGQILRIYADKLK